MIPKEFMGHAAVLLMMSVFGVHIQDLEILHCEQHQTVAFIGLHVHLRDECWTYQLFRNVQEDHRHGTRYV